MNKLTSLFLKRRGYTREYFKQISNPYHQKLQNIDKIAHLLKEIHDSRDKIVIMPDFDTDGISAGTIGLAGLSDMGFRVSLYVPHPEKGYGIDVEDIKNVQKAYPDVKYIISCDVGITCYDAFFYAYQHGIKVLITDHHEEQRDKPVPKYTDSQGKIVTGKRKLYCETIVNPCQLSETYKLRDICGAFVFYQVLMYYASLYEDEAEQEQIRRLAVFAGIGTIGDMMRLINENRALLKDAISIARFIYNNDNPSVYKLLKGHFCYVSAFRGLFILFDELTNQKKIRKASDIDEKFFGWTIAPIYNSIKRMSMPMLYIFGVFFGKTEKQQRECVKKVIAANEERKETVQKAKHILDQEFAANLQPYAPFIYLADAPGGILGLLANEYEQEHNLPTFVVNKDTLNGSGRSFSYFPVITKLENTEFHVAGHQEAFGIGFKDINQVDRFNHYLMTNVLPLAEKAEQEQTDDCDLTLAMENTDGNYDTLLKVDECREFYRDMQSLKPFGAGFNEPKIRVRFNPQNAQLVTMGKNNEHLKVILSNDLQLIAWNKADMKGKILALPVASFTGDFSLNHFGGRTSLQMIGDFEVKKKPIKELFKYEKQEQN